MKPKLSFGLIFLALLTLVSRKLNAQYSPPWEWIKTMSSTGGIYGKGLTIDRSIDRSSKIYVAGGFDGTVDFDPGPETFNLSSGAGLSAFISKISESGNFLWTKALLGSGGEAYAGNIAIDPIDGDIYVRGRFKGTIDFDPGEGIHTITFTTTCTDVLSCGKNFVSKLDGDGNFIWANVIGESANVFVASIAIDPGGNGDVYTTGTFNGKVDFDPGTGTFELTSAGDNDIFISKLNRFGDFQWAKQIGGPGNDFCYSIAMDPMGNGDIYTTGYFTGTVDFDPGPDDFDLIAGVGQYIFISKLDDAGNFKWAKRLGRAMLINTNHIGSVALDPAGSGDVYTTGSFQGTSDFNPGDSICNLKSVGGSDIFISKLDNTGNFKWAKAMGGTNQDYGVALAIQPGESENIYIIGRFKGTADFDPGEDSSNLTSVGDYDIFISKLDSSGNFQWAKAIKGLSEEYIADIALDQESLFLTGFFLSPSVSFDSTTIPNINPFGTGADLFIAKLDIDFKISIEEPKKPTINLYPNPASDEMTIEFEGDEVHNVEITLFNTIGEDVLLGRNENIIHKTTIDISALSTGIYFMEIDLDGKRMMQKIVKE